MSCTVFWFQPRIIFQAELELLLLDENNLERGKKHFNFKSIEEQEDKNSKKRRRRKQLKKKPQEVLPEKDDFEVDLWC